ncbi:MAG TPA: hypothetical protein VGL02_28540 [Streptomyces sp.]
MQECHGRWPQVSGDRDELTMLARQERNRLILTMTLKGKHPQTIAGRVGLGTDTVKRIAQAEMATAAHASRGQEPEEAGSGPRPSRWQGAAHAD